MDRMLSDENENIQIAVISPYKAQISLLKKQLPKSNRIKIDTVDGFQGKESDVVIFSMTRTWRSFRFLADARRLNVALSRARNKIVIVGNLVYGRNNPLLYRISEWCEIIEML